MQVTTPILKIATQGDSVKALQANLTNIGLAIPAVETYVTAFGSGTESAVRKFQASVNLPVTGEVDGITQSMLNNAASLYKSTESNLSGVLVLDYGAAAAGTTVILYSVGYGGNDTKLAEAKTDVHGVYSLSYKAPGVGANIQVRTVDTQGKEIVLSSTVYNTAARKSLNLVAPAAVVKQDAEYTRLAASVQATIGGNGIGDLAKAEEGAARQDLTLLNRATGWDARLIALAASAVQASTASGLGTDVLYAMFRAGLPNNLAQLALVSTDTVTAALKKAQVAGIINLTDADIAKTVPAVQAASTKILLSIKATGGINSGREILSTAGIKDAGQQQAFANLVINESTPGDDFWQKAAQLKIPSAQIDQLKVQGKCYYLTLNNLALSQKIQQDIGASSDLSVLAINDYYDSNTWKTTLTGLAGQGGAATLDTLIPSGYAGATADKLEAYAGDMARRVRVSYPTHTVARMVEKNTLPIGQSAAPVAAFLKAAADKGYQMGRTPVNSFLKSTGAGLPALSAADTTQLKTLHRLFQITPSTESMQAALKLGFKSAGDVAGTYKRSEFMEKYAASFPSSDEADLVYRRSQQISSITFNFFSMAKGLDTNPPIYALSSSSQAVQNAKNSIIEQFPSMQTLFGSVDYCQCDDCQSVLSPAAYFVDLMEFLRTSTINAKGYTPLDTLIGSLDGVIGTGAGKIPSRRADLAALPLTCANTNTAMPYIDIVNEILEYYVSNGVLDAGVAYDTGTVSTDDLTAEPQHILAGAYAQLMKANAGFGFPLGLPFDLWLETVRGFYSYFKIPLVRVLDALRPVDQLELFTDASNLPYYRASIFSEMLGLSPSEYAIFSNTNPLATWFGLYSYPTEAIALNGGTFPAAPPNFSYTSLASAKCLAQYLGLTYQELTDLLLTGFLNPALAAISFQIQRFGIDLGQAFRYTDPGANPLSAADKAAFEANLAAITQQYKAINPASTFDAKAWLIATLPVNYSKTVLVLSIQSAGCDFGTTSLVYADGTAATPLDFLKFNLFVRLWKKTGWDMDEVDRALQIFFATGPGGLPAPGAAAFGTDFSEAWQTALVYMAHLGDLATAWTPVLGKTALLPLWSPLPVTGNNPLYAQIFLTPGVLNIDPAFDDPLGKFPGSTTDALSVHQPGIQGALGLSSTDVSAILADVGAAADQISVVVNGQPVKVAAFTLANLSLLYRYNLLAGSLGLNIPDFIGLKGLAVDMGGATPGVTALNPFVVPTNIPLNVIKDDLLYTQTSQFAQEAGLVAASGFTMEDLRWLLLHQFDPVGKYSIDKNALLTLAQSIGSGLQQIQSAETVPADLGGLSDDLIQQKLSGLFSASLLNNLTGLLTDITAFSASQGGIAAFAQIDPTPFGAYPELSFSYDSVLQVQTVTYRGALLDWKIKALEVINGSGLFAGLLNQIQAEAKPAFDTMVGNLLSAWASLVRYEATRQPVAAALNFGATPPTDPAFATGYDPVNQVQWAVYRGVLTAPAMKILSPASASADYAALLSSLQGQSLPAFSELLSYLLGLWTSVQTYQATQAAVPAVNAIDPSKLTAYPQLQVSYDPVPQIQTLSYQGILTTTIETALTTLLPASVVLANLLQNIRTQTLAFYEAQAAGWITVALPAAWDPLLDASGVPYQNLDATKMLKTLKAELIKVFSPLVAESLSSKLLSQTLVGNLSSPAALTSSLLTEIGIVSDPNNPGRSLQGAFLSLGVPGISAKFYASPDKTGPVLGGAAVVASTADNTDPANPGPGAADSIHFEGYLQAPTDGPYRFFAELGNIGAQVLFQIDPPATTSILTNPILNYKAVKAGDESSQFVTLQGGLSYHYTLDFTNLGAGGAASLLVQGETLSKGPLSQLRLYPQAIVDGFNSAWILLSKSLQLIEGTGLDESELAWISANPSKFSGFRLSSLPTQPIVGASGMAQSLFAQFLTLADYADLRRGPAGGTDGLISVFQHVGQTFSELLNSGSSNLNMNTPWTILGNLTRRDPQVVRDVALQFGLLTQVIVPLPAPAQLQLQAVADFATNKSIRRIWEALKVIQTVGLPVASIVRSTQIVSPGRLVAALDPGAGSAGDLRNAVSAQYSAEVWRPVAKSIFDPLRQKKRDALVAYIVRDLQLNSEEQLFEYFLVDPGMEPVVQTSRLRLALSTVQTYIQRCLLNLESGHDGNPQLNISPSAIESDYWEWMKRYRVWEANREIFLYPENWMVPELRLDTTDLFQTMIGDLLKGDITKDLVEASFHKYLQGLELRARLDIVATYLDQAGPPDTSGQIYPDYTLHVVGRTHSHPHQYFYRSFANGLWSGWIQITAPIEGDHIAIAVWRNRVNLFWVTFQTLAQSQTPSSFSSGSTDLTGLTFSQLATNLGQLAPQLLIQVQLNWCEYFQGVWSARLSSDVNKYPPVPVSAPFDKRQVYIHVSKGAPDATFGIDGPVFIHLDFPGQSPYSFLVTNKNSNPDFGQKYGQNAPAEPFLGVMPDTTQYDGGGYLATLFYTGNDQIVCGEPWPTIESILQSIGNYGVVVCSNSVSTPFLPPTNAQYQSAGALVSPFFYKDSNSTMAGAAGVTNDESTFFVQPSLTEYTVETWPGWVVGIPPSKVDVLDPVWAKAPLLSQISGQEVVHLPVPQGDPADIESLYTVQDRTDWLTSPATMVSYGTTQIGETGGLAGNLQFNQSILNR